MSESSKKQGKIREISQTDAAVSAIRSKIIDLSIAPGSRIDEPILLQEFMLGRTPAREALNRLVAEGFVNILPRRGGTFVRKLDLEEIEQILFAHQLVENILAKFCKFSDLLTNDLIEIQKEYSVHVNNQDYLKITEYNELFHMRMNQTIKNSFISEFSLSTHRHVRRLLVHLYNLESSSLGIEEQQFQFQNNLKEHEMIIKAVREKDRDALIRILPEHARATQDRLINIMKNSTIDEFNVIITPWNQN